MYNYRFVFSGKNEVCREIPTLVGRGVRFGGRGNLKYNDFASDLTYLFKKALGRSIFVF